MCLNLTVKNAYHKAAKEDVKIEAHHQNKMHTVVHKSQIKQAVDQTINDLIRRIEDWEGQDSGWVIDEVLELFLNVAKYNPLRGSSYIELPKELAAKHPIIHPQSKDDEMCFKWAVIAAKNPNQRDLQRVTKLKKLDCIKDKRKHFCIRCLHCFTNEELQKHTADCSENKAQKIVLPTAEVDKNGRQGNILNFFNYKNALECPFIIYADFESKLETIDSVANTPTVSYTEKYQTHKAISYCYKIVCINEKYNVGPKLYIGDDAAERFVTELREEAHKINNIYKKANEKNGYGRHRQSMF